MNSSTARFHPYQRHASKTNIETTTPLPNLTIGLQPTPPKRTTEAPQICKVGKYILLERSGGGGLHKAVNIETQTEYACKIIDVNKFRETLAPVFHITSHEGINKVVEILVSDSYAYVFFERSYGDLHSYVRSKRRLKEEEASKLFSQIACVVSHCHSSGVVLRDLKLRKFVFQNPERTKIKLEGLEDACLLEGQDDILEDKHGCPAYVSPEILQSQGGYSGRAADIWSLGVMLYTMVVGRYPFHDSEPTALFTKIRRGHFAIPDTVSSKAKCLIRSMMRRDPDERLMASEVLEHPWFSSSFPISNPCRIDQKLADQTVPDLSTDVDNASFFI
ncbi:predicted protein [Nematostella vectensis]|uniref:Protein kinase domain-containing protein n=1 Tax=Nematostella vectensis TaxID=45351 RepID=A7S0A1_NEMVE|nr:tribbles homolog 2 [Nematostella vectensis]EDO42841.1 predicted protein [Nematostella vectensis]|eukprot:XP_001634904.1 predicted protein [Nematostella vectensis]